MEYDRPSTGHFHGSLSYSSRPKSAAEKKEFWLVLDEACLRKDHLWLRMDHLLSAGYLVENQVSTSSFSTTHLLTFANHQPEQVRIHSHDGLNTFVSGRRGTVVHHNFEVSLNNYLFALHLVSGTAASTVITRLTRSPTTTRTPSSSTSRSKAHCQRYLVNIVIVFFIAIVSCQHCHHPLPGQRSVS